LLRVFDHNSFIIIRVDLLPDFRRLGVTEWSGPSGKLSRRFGPPLERGAETAPPRLGGETLVQHH